MVVDLALLAGGAGDPWQLDSSKLLLFEAAREETTLLLRAFKRVKESEDLAKQRHVLYVRREERCRKTVPNILSHWLVVVLCW